MAERISVATQKFLFRGYLVFWVPLQVYGFYLHMYHMLKESCSCHLCLNELALQSTQALQYAARQGHKTLSELQRLWECRLQHLHWRRT
jgi:hypothetical protein